MAYFVWGHLHTAADNFGREETASFDLEEPGETIRWDVFRSKNLTMRIQFARNADSAKRFGKPIVRCGGRATSIAIKEGKLFIDV